jgi:uncharacterized protein YkwD
MSHSGWQLALRHFDRGLTQKIAAAIVSLLVCLIFAPIASARTAFPVYGANGDAGATDECPAGQYFVGVVGNVGAWVDQITVYCAPRNPDGSIGSAKPLASRGGSGGGYRPEMCDTNEVITRIYVSRTGDYQIRGLDFTCKNVKTNATHVKYFGGNARTDGDGREMPCGPTEAATGMRIQWGKYVNGLGLICNNMPSASVAGGPGGGSSGGNSCPTIPAGQHPGQLMGMDRCEREVSSRAPSSFATGNQFVSESTSRILCLINAERTCRGLPPVQQEAHLIPAARGHALAAKDIKWWVKGADSHTNPNTGSTVESRIKAAQYCIVGVGGVKEVRYGENTFNGAGTGGNHWDNDGNETKFKCPGVGCGSPLAAMDWWMNISTHGHREAILDPRWTSIGIAVLGEVADPALATAPNRGLYVLDFGMCHR